MDSSILPLVTLEQQRVIAEVSSLEVGERNI